MEVLLKIGSEAHAGSGWGMRRVRQSCAEACIWGFVVVSIGVSYCPYHGSGIFEVLDTTAIVDRGNHNVRGYRGPYSAPLVYGPAPEFK